MNIRFLLKVLNTAVLAFGIFLCLCGFAGIIAFGHGLGDIVYYAMIYPLTIIHLVWTIRIRKATDWFAIIFPLVIFFTTTLLFCLKATIWRGSEYSWRNGKLFYLKHDISLSDSSIKVDSVPPYIDHSLDTSDTKVEELKK